MATRKISKKPRYNERKATQAAALLLKLNGGRMNYTKLIKLLYNIDREALRRWRRPITFDEFFSLPYGQIVSQTLDRVEEELPGIKSYWHDFIETHRYNAQLIRDCKNETLSRAEVGLIEEMFTKYEHSSWQDMAREHHDPKLFPEYIDPKGSRIEIEYRRLMELLGFSPEELQDFESSLEELAFLETVA